MVEWLLLRSRIVVIVVTCVITVGLERVVQASSSGKNDSVNNSVD